jgi:hypothetical protein
MSDGSYPIANEADLDKAIHAVGRGGSSHNAIRAHIIRRARSLGASSKIPDNWNSDGSLKGDSVSKTDAVAKDMGPELDDGIDCMDPTVPLAAPEDDAPGDTTDPGSPAWEAIDAATACKWTSILARARVAVDLLAEREMLEAAACDPDDMENAFDLGDVCCAIDYAISMLAPFAVAEQSAADCGEADMMAMVGKSAADLETLTAVRKAMESADLADPLAKIEGLGWIAKAGRVLSSVNEAHIREAAGRLNTVLQSLPSAPTTDDGQPVAKQEGPTVDATETQDAQVAKDGTPAPADEQAKNSDPVNAGGVTGMGQPRDSAQAALPGDAQTPGRQVIKAAEWCVQVYDRSRRFVGLADPSAIVQQVTKADDGEKKPMQAVFDQDGDLIGIVDPDAIQPVTGAGGPSAADTDGDGTEAAPAATDDTDMTPQPPAATGTPADAMPDDGVAKQDSTQDVAAVLKSIVAEAVAAALGAQAPAEDIAKQADVAGLSEQVETLKARLAVVEETPAAPKVFSNGQTPPAHQLRGQDQGAPPPVDIAKAAELKRTLYTGTAAEQQATFKTMEAAAVSQLAAMHAQRRQPA